MIYNTSSSTENKHLEIDTKVSLYIKHRDDILQQSTMNKPYLAFVIGENVQILRVSYTIKITSYRKATL